MNKIEKQVERVREWAEARDLYNNTTPLKQLEKFGEEFLEFVGHSYQMELYETKSTKMVATQTWSGIHSKLEDDVGDMLVCLVNALSCGGQSKQEIAYGYEEAHTNPVEDLKKDVESAHSKYFAVVSGISHEEGFISGLDRWGDMQDPDCYIIYELFDHVKTLAFHFDIDPVTALESSIDEIWDRKGKFVDGKFCKDEK